MLNRLIAAYLRLRQMPISEALRFLLWRSKRLINNTLRPLIHSLTGSYSPPPSQIQLHEDAVFILQDYAFKQSPYFTTICRHFIKHEFDILGSGWQNHNAHDFTLVSPNNSAYSKKLQGFLLPEYRPINWQLDIKSGFSWQAKDHHLKTKYGHISGVDIKMPWELARCHHLTSLAVEFAQSKHTHWARECEYQILDFMAQNPPNYGVNWACAMDVGIRACNWIACFDILKAHNHQFLRDFEIEFAKFIYWHALYIWQNLEWLPKQRSNHYLADLAGLIFIACRLKECAETNKWLGFACSELVHEIRTQFYEDGSNFESSTFYHRLSAELVLESITILKQVSLERWQRIGSQKISWPIPQLHPQNSFQDLSTPEIQTRLTGMHYFMQAIAKPSGEAVQVGDNDSGRLFKLRPRLKQNEDGTITEDHLRMDFEPQSYTPPHLSKFKSDEAVDMTWQKLSAKAKAAKFTQQYQIPLDLPIQLNELQVYAFKQFGLYIFKTANFFLSFRLGPVGQEGKGAHAHNDQLSVEIEVNHKPLVRDPGTYCYTNNVELRNQYRSIHAHFAPQLVNHQELAPLHLGVFYLPSNYDTELTHLSPSSVAGYHTAFGYRVWRAVKIEANSVLILDWTEGDISLKDLGFFLAGKPPLPFSCGYGLVDYSPL